ncbi:MAG: hypothetical protein RLZZ165_1743, partial [Bacteroidota bacterium]
KPFEYPEEGNRGVDDYGMQAVYLLNHIRILKVLEGVEGGKLHMVAAPMKKARGIVRGNVSPVIERPGDAVGNLENVKWLQSVAKLRNRLANRSSLQNTENSNPHLLNFSMHL